MILDEKKFFWTCIEQVTFRASLSPITLLFECSEHQLHNKIFLKILLRGQNNKKKCSRLFHQHFPNIKTKHLFSECELGQYTIMGRKEEKLTLS